MTKSNHTQKINQSIPKTQAGYAALISVLVISAAVLVIGISVSLLSISEIQIALSGKKNDEALDITEGCTEDTLLYLNENNSLPASITLPEGSCSVTLDSQSDNDWTFTVSTTLDGYTKSVQIEASRSSILDVTSWQEI